MQTPSPETSDTDLAACVAMMRSGSKTFFAASRLLPPRVRTASIALYAFCRVADDLIDEGGDVSGRLFALRQRLDHIYAGVPANHVEDQALSIVVQQHDLPRILLDALLEGFEWDAQGRRYDCLEALEAYAARVAGTVGAMMCWIMGSNAPQTLARACELGMAMQLTNIARDVGEDARNNRIYLPLNWLREAGVDVEQWLKQPLATGGVKSVIGRLLDRADVLYKRAQTGIAELPPDCRAAILAAGVIYAEIGRQLRREGLDSVSGRTVVSTGRKMFLLFTALTQAGFIYTRPQQPAPLAAIRFLVQGCTGPCEVVRARNYFPNRAMPQRVEWLLGLFERLETERRVRKSVGLSA